MAISPSLVQQNGLKISDSLIENALKSSSILQISSQRRFVLSHCALLNVIPIISGAVERRRWRGGREPASSNWGGNRKGSLHAEYTQYFDRGTPYWKYRQADMETNTLTCAKILMSSHYGCPTLTIMSAYGFRGGTFKGHCRENSHAILQSSITMSMSLFDRHNCRGSVAQKQGGSETLSTP